MLNKPADINYWKQQAIEELRRYPYLEDSIKMMKEEVADINARLSGMSARFGDTKVQGGASDLEAQYAERLYKKEQLMRQIKLNERLYARVRRTLGKMTDQEREILRLAYIHRERGYIEKVMDILYVERSRAYDCVKISLDKYIKIRYLWG